MDNEWERSIDFYQVSDIEVKKILSSFDDSLELESYIPISIGCRNSNYIVKAKSDKKSRRDSVTLGCKKYVLRVSSVRVPQYKNEQAAFQALFGKVIMPRMLSVMEEKEHVFLLYEYIPSVSLSQQQEKGFSDNIVEQAAKNAAIIHSLNKDEINGLYQQELPPFSCWFEYFLSNPYTVQKLGGDLVQQVKVLIASHKEDLGVIDSYQTFIHSDYRPANMILDDKNRLYVVDWEYACFGHMLADIGQFFRYQNCFTKDNILLFETVYNQYARTSLPHNWYSLSKLRDLVNPLQMLCTAQEQPKKEKDLINLVKDTLNYFQNHEGYKYI